MIGGERTAAVPGEDVAGAEDARLRRDDIQRQRRQPQRPGVGLFAWRGGDPPFANFTGCRFGSSSFHFRRSCPCLYAATGHPGGFYPGQKYPRTDNSLHPFFVASIGPTLGEDAVYLPEAEDEYDTFYVLASPTEISATGTRVDHSISNFQCELSDELPEWLEEQPVQRFLKLTPESDTAMSFALAFRKFVGRKGESGDGTFRPAFPDAATPYTGLRHDTIAAYLLRDFVRDEGSSVFAALKTDALVKRDAALAILRENISGFRKSFEQRFEK
jgi:hypothetical protein